MVFFNDPVSCVDHTQKAVRMALEMQDRARELHRDWLKTGYELDLRIGMAVGYATLGNIGFEGRMDYGAIGNVTNLAARLCGEANAGQIVTNQKTLGMIKDLVEFEPLKDLELKGVSRAVPAFNIVRLRGNGKTET